MKKIKKCKKEKTSKYNYMENNNFYVFFYIYFFIFFNNIEFR